ncbi:MAG: formylglycine-generating enzyme family protein, partial [Deltaproteobacteria bacterium]|nr:formylglycine-generating enzyme family protein [Nannocystaceae bacterium]
AVTPPADPPKPAVPTLPDGTAIVPCADAPANMSCIPGGRFVRGTNDGPENAGPQLEVFLQTFYVDQFEVTIAEYKACVKRGDCRKGGPFYPDFSRPHQPIVGMSWFGARDFCSSRGKSLPTEAQWEKAARGPDGAKYAWGDDAATCRRAVIRDKRGRSCGVPMARSSEPYKGRTFVVGSRPAGVYGLFDMTGNAWEYVADWYSADLAACGEPCSGVDPKGPCGGADDCPGATEKIVKGGSWYWGPDYAAGWYRRPQPPANRPFHHYGFRCAASVGQAVALRGKPRDPLAPVPGEKNEDGTRGL